MRYIPMGYHFMATKIFSGTGNWADVANWTNDPPGPPPTVGNAADNVVITQGATLTITTAVAAIDLSTSNGTPIPDTQNYNDGNVITIVTGGTLTLSSQLELTGGTITLAGGMLINTGTTDSNGTGYVSQLVMAGNVNTGDGSGSVSSIIEGFGVIDATIGFFQVIDGNGVGTIVASGGTLELKQVGIGAGAYSIANTGSSVLRLDAAVAAGSTITFVGNAGGLFDASGTALNGQIITGFAGADQIKVLGATQYVFSVDGSNTRVVTNTETFTLTGSALASFGTVVSSGGFNGTGGAACYLAGTKILTSVGKVAVEDLMIGDRLITADAGPQVIRWIGQRAYLARLVNQHHRDALMPVRIVADALAENSPSSDLFVSPEHMMVLNGVLVASHSLVNGTTITRFEDLDVVKYFHIELDQHSVIFAEGAASESYLDTGNRNMFTNVVDYAELGMPVGSTVPCLPIASDGPVLAAIRAGIADRAEACGFTTSADADLHLLVGGAVVYPSAVAGNSYSFDIAEHAGEMLIVSRSVVPAEIEAVSTDRRRLGVAVAKLTLRGNGMSVDVMAGEKLLAEGFFPADGGHRWTNGSAQFPAALLALMDGAFSVTVELVGTGLRYPVASRGDVVALAAARNPRVASAQRLVA